MANKKTINTEDVENINDTKTVTEVAKKEVKTPAKSPRKYSPSDMIPCRSITFGELLLTGTKSKMCRCDNQP